MGLESQEAWFTNVLENIESFNKTLDDKIEKEQQQLKACKKKTELEIKLTHEINLHNELSDRLAELSRRGSELDRVCAAFETHLTIADSDQHRLDNAKENYQLAKELTGIRLDFTAPPNVGKGYIKCERRRLLQPFEVALGDSAAAWAVLEAALCDKENQPLNGIK